MGHPIKLVTKAIICLGLAVLTHPALSLAASTGGTSAPAQGGGSTGTNTGTGTGTGSGTGGGSGSGGKDCQSYEDEVKTLKDTIGAKQTGGWNDPALKDPNYVDPDAKKGMDLIKEARTAGCNLSTGIAENFTKGDGSIIRSEFAPSAPGEKTAAQDQTYLKNAKLPNVTMPKPKPEPETDPDEVIVEEPEPEKSTGECGTTSVAFADYIKEQQTTSLYASQKTVGGAQISMSTRASYKDGCAGVDKDRKPRPSPDKPATVCKGNQYGNFGFVYASYKNRAQDIDIGTMWTMTPEAAAVDPGVVAFKDIKTGKSLEPNGCRLSTYTCGKPGDIIMLQTNPSASSTTRFNKFMIYVGSNVFYEMSPTGGGLMKSALKPEYASLTYAAIRLSCAGTPDGQTGGTSGTSGSSGSTSGSGGTSGSTTP